MQSRPLSRWLAVVAVLGAAALWLAARWRPQTDAAGAPSTVAAPHAEHASSAEGSATTRPARAVGVARTEDFRRDDAVPPGAKVAELYKTAFGLMAQLTDEERAMIKDPTKEVDADKAEGFYKMIQPIMDLLRRAAAEGPCDWGLGDVNFETQLPHIGKAQELAQFALWAAGYRFATDPTGAIADLGARARLGDSLSDLLIGGLVAVSFERGALDLLRQHAGTLDGDARAAALEFLSTPALEEGFRRSLEGERTGARNTIEQLLAKPVEERMRAVAAMSGTTDSRTQENQETLQKIMSDPVAARAETAFLIGVEEQAAQSLNWPEEKFRAWQAQVTASLQAHPFAGLTLPVIENVRAQYQRMRIERQMMVAGLGILQGGPAQAGRFADPVMGGNFRYTPAGAGFELSSAYQVKGKALTMSFGGK